MKMVTDRIRTVWQRLGNEPHLKRNVLIVIGVVVLGLGTLGYILKQQGAMEWPWEDKFHFYVTFEEAPAINASGQQEVRIAGVLVGNIVSASVTDEGNARVEVAVEPGHQIYQNARAVLRPKSPLNSMYITLDPGGPPAEPVAEGGVLPVTNSSRPIQVDQVLGHLDKNTRAALTTLLAESDVALANAPNKLPGGLEATKQVVQDLRPVVSALQTRKEKLAQLVTALGQISSAVGDKDQRLSSLASSLQKTLATVGQRNQELDSALAQLPEFTSELEHAMGKVGDLTVQLNPTLDNVRVAADELPDSLSRFTETVDQIGETVDTARPVVNKAKPVVHDLRPLIRDVRGSLGDIKAVTQRLDAVTSAVVPYLNDLAAFVYNTRSVVSLRGKDGSVYRAAAQFSQETISGLLPLLPKLEAAASR